MQQSQVCIMITIVLYLILMLAVGYVCSKKNENTGDFYLGGRQLGPIVTAMSAEASDMSSWLLMGLPGVAYLTGVADAAWTAIGLGIGTYVNWLIVAKRLRRYSAAANDSITLPDFFANRFRDKSNALLGISAVIIIIFFIPYTASGFAACGKLFSALFGVDYGMAMVISSIVIVGYTALGGFLAASTTDLIQSIVMTIALFIVLFFGVSVAGGLDVVMANAGELPGYLSMSFIHDMETNTAKPYSILTICSLMAWGLGYFGMPHILLRFMAIGDDSKIKISRRIASVWVVISMAVAIFIGIVGYSASLANAIPTLTGATSETIIVEFSAALSQYGVVPALVAGLVLAGILACTMSTADSQLLAASSSVSENIFKGVFGMNLSNKTSMLVARGTVLVIAVLGVLLARDPNSSVFGIVSFAWAGFGATFGPVMLAALFWKRSNRYGALAGLVVGGVMVFAWKYGIAKLGGVFAIYELLPAFIAAGIAIVVVSLLTPAPEKEIVDEFEAVASMK